jgi:mxaJ protein
MRVSPRTLGWSTVAASLAVVLALASSRAGSAEPAESTLRVCADPNNLPFSNRRLEGFENAIVALVARELHAKVEYNWWPQRRGFLRYTLNADACDLVPGIATEVDSVLTTEPYYRSTYVFAWPSNRALDIRSWDDPRLRDLRIGVTVIGDDGINSPPVHALGRFGVVDNVVGFGVYDDYGRDDPSTRIVDALRDDAVDVAVPWGPIAGFLARRHPGRFVIRPVPDAPPGMRMEFDISMGVRHGDHPRKRAIDAILRRRRAEVRRILDDHEVPRIPGAYGGER